MDLEGEMVMTERSMMIAAKQEGIANRGRETLLELLRRLVGTGRRVVL